MGGSTEMILALNRIESEKNSIQRFIEDGFNSVGEILTQMQTKEKRLMQIERELDSVRESLVRRETELDSVRESMERRAVELNSLRESLDRRETELNSLRESLEKRETEFNSVQRKEAELEERLREVGFREEKALEGAKLAEGFQQRHEELRLKEQVSKDLIHDLEAMIDELDSDKESLRIERQVLAFREECFDHRSRDLDSRENKLHSREMGLNSTEAFVNRRWKSYLFNKKQLQKSKIQEKQQNQLEEDEQAADNYPSPDIVFRMDGKALQVFLNERSQSLDSMCNDVLAALGLSSDPAKLVLDAMEGFYPPHLMNKNGDVVRNTCVVLLEQLNKMSPSIRPRVKADAFRVACDWRFKVPEEDGRSLEVLAFLKLLSAYKLVSGWDGNELPSLFEFLAQRRAAPQSCRALDSDMVPGLNSQVQTNSPVDPGTSLWTELPDSVRIALKPEKLVLDAMQCCFHSVLEGRGDLKLKVMRSFKTSLMKLLDVLLELEIETNVKVEAMNFATEWKAQVLRNTCNPEDAWCFLLFVITYSSVSCCGINELVDLLKIVKKQTEVANLFRRLGLTDNFPDYITTLVERGKQLEAIPDSNEYKLLEMLPEISPPKGHLKSPDQNGKQICEIGSNSSQSQAEKQARAVEKSLASRAERQELDHEASTSSYIAQNQEQARNSMENEGSQPQKHIVISSSSTTASEAQRSMVPLKKRGRGGYGNYSKVGLMQEETCQEAVAMPSSGVCFPAPLPAKRLRQHLVA